MGEVDESGVLKGQKTDASMKRIETRFALRPREAGRPVRRPMPR